MEKILTIKGYDIYRDKDGFFGIVKQGEQCTNCAYRYLHIVLHQKGI